jgi:hypothetical protein
MATSRKGHRKPSAVSKVQWASIATHESATEEYFGQLRISKLYAKSKHEAKRRGIIFMLQPAEYAAIWRDDCGLCGIVFSKVDRWLSRSLDRIDPGGVYCAGNVRFICFGCNAKRSLSDLLAERKRQRKVECYL